jgi:hypothetical protein
MIACCGLDCSKCEARAATLEDDDVKRADVAKKWSVMYNSDIKPEQINCTGCRVEGIKFHYCENICGIRKCCMARGFGTCAECGDYICDTLAGFIKMAPEAGEALERQRRRS